MTCSHNKMQRLRRESEGDLGGKREEERSIDLKVG